MRNYLVVLFRNLRREKLYAAINIAGLALGIACCLILGLFLRSELTYDRHFRGHEHLFRIVNEITTGGRTDAFAATSRVLAPMLAADHPEIKAYVRFQRNGNSQGGTAMRHGDTVYYWDNTYFVDPNIFEVFRHDIVYGDPKTAMREPGSLAVSETFARTYFGDANPIGESVTTDGGVPQKITLVFADPPANTHLKYDVLFSNNLPFLRDPDDTTLRRQQLWGISQFTYVVMAPDFDPARWAAISDQFFQRYMADTGKAIGSRWRSWLEPLADIHLHSEVQGDEPKGNRMYLYGCAAIALFILVVACINYMNLATARATRRARSVGIRKILGASRLSLGMQFLGEALLFSLIALAFAAVIVELVMTLTPLNSLMGQQVNLDLQREPLLALWLVGLSLLIGVLSGIYPALYLSSWAPLTALTGKQIAGKAGFRFREVLVLVQFTISAAVIASTLLMAAQMHYVSTRPLGFERENRLVVTLRGFTTLEKIPTIRTELARNSHILGVSQTFVVPGQPLGVNLTRVESKAGVLEPTLLSHMPIDDHFVSVMGLEIVQGRDFTKRLLTDLGTSFIVNETMVRTMGWTEALGKRLQIGTQSGRVIGVVRDFNFKSLHTLIEPFAMYPLNQDLSGVPAINRPFVQQLLVMKISGEDIGGTLEFVERVITQADSRHPFEYTFLDESLDRLYKSERQLMTLIGIFAAVCIFIACLGLFGLAAFATEQRTREIGTRKVLGATAMQIIVMLAQRIMVLVVIAAVLASVLAYFAIDEWLTAFAYRAGINPLMFLLAAATAAAVAFATVALQSYKTAHADPVEALRHV
jgi:putative ABC transport system permease protein